MDEGRVIEGGAAVGEGGEGGDAGGGCGFGGRRDSFAVFEAGFAEGSAHVDEAGAEDGAAALEDRHAIGAAEVGAEIGDVAVADEQAAGFVEAGGRVDEADVSEEEVRHCGQALRVERRLSTSSTAMRTATPISTCSPMTLWWGSSATALSISTPRFMGPGVHDEDVLGGQVELRAVEAVEAEVFALGGDQAALHALPLQAEHHHHVGARKALFHVVEHGDAHGGDGGGDEGGRADDADLGAHGREQVDVGAGDPAVQDVAADGDSEAFEAAAAAAEGERVEQGLGGVLVGAVAGVDDGGGDFLGQQVGRAGLVVADDEEVAAHGVKGARGVEQGFALIHAGGADGHVDDVGAEALAGEFEAGAGAGAVLEEQVDEGAAAQQVALGFAGAVEEDVALGEVEQVGDFGGVEAFDGEQVLVGVVEAAHGAAAGRAGGAPGARGIRRGRGRRGFRRCRGSWCCR